MSEELDTWVIEVPYFQCDAAFSEIAPSVNLPFIAKFSRRTITSGSCIYEITTQVEQQNLNIGTVRFRFLKPDKTLVHLTPASDYAKNTGTLLFLLQGFWQTLFLEQESSEELPTVGQKTVPRPTPPSSSDKPNRGGNPGKEYNDRAWARIEAGEPRSSAFRGWLEDRGLNAADPDIQAANSDAFRKAMERKAKKKNTTKGRTDET